MKTHLWLTACAAAVTFLVVTTPAAAAEKKASAGNVAVVAGQPVTAEELNAAVGNRLMRVRTEEYNIRRGSLEEIVAARLLRDEAARRKITIEELLRTEVEAKVTVPSPDDLESFYEGVKERFPGASRDEALQQIADGMRRQQASRKKAELVQRLRAAAHVSVLLDPPRSDVKAEGPVRGSATAPITIVEFSDFECPFCSRAEETLRKVRDVYGDRVRLVFRDYPLPSHRGSPKAAEAAHCADEQGKFWEMHDRLFSKNGVQQTETELRKAAADVGLDEVAFSRCFASGKYASTWKSSQEEGLRAGVGSTPTFFLNGRMIIGAAPFESFATVIDEELEHAGMPAGSLTSGRASDPSPVASRTSEPRGIQHR
jgi:protein-disulfide isomerase